MPGLLYLVYKVLVYVQEGGGIGDRGWYARSIGLSYSFHAIMPAFVPRLLAHGAHRNHVPQCASS